MALHKIKDFYPDYRDQFGDHDIVGYDLYSGNEKVGSVDNLLVDDEGKFRYLVINTGVWIFGKKVLLPIGRSRLNYSDRRVYVDGLTRDQVENLPGYDDRDVDYNHEEQVRGIYRPPAAPAGRVDQVNRASASQTAPLDTPTPLDTNAPVDATPGVTARDRTTAYDRDTLGTYNDTPETYDRDTYRYARDPSLYNINDRDHQNLRLYEERLIADKTRQRTGQVIVGKHVETEDAHISVPIEKERVVIERTTPTDAGTVIDPAAVDSFREGEVARVEVYEETPNVRKEAFVREEVNVRKEVDRETVEANETLRKERLDIDKEGNPIVNGPDRLPDDRL
jgi:uncharacterized protein (TIGR02271 family)